MDEITMFTSIRPQTPDDTDLNEMRAGARRRLAAATRPGARGRSRWRWPALAGGLTAAVAGGAAAAVVLASGGTAAPAPHAGHTGTVVTAAWTVRENSDGTVTVDIRQFLHPAELQRVLRGDGINAYVRQIPYTTGKPVGHPTCTYADTNQAPQSVQRAVVTLKPPLDWTIDPAAMPKGSALFLVGGPIKVLFTRPDKAPGQVTAIGAAQPVVLNSSKLPACVP